MGARRIHRSCRSRVASDLLHEQISFLRTSTGTVGTPTRIHIVGTCESGVTPRDTHTQLGNTSGGPREQTANTQSVKQQAQKVHSIMLTDTTTLCEPNKQK